MREERHHRDARRDSCAPVPHVHLNIGVGVAVCAFLSLCPQGHVAVPRDHRPKHVSYHRGLGIHHRNPDGLRVGDPRLLTAADATKRWAGAAKEH